MKNIRFLYVISRLSSNGQKEYARRTTEWTPDFTKARIFKRLCDASNSNFAFMAKTRPNYSITIDKIVAVDTN